MKITITLRHEDIIQALQEFAEKKSGLPSKLTDLRRFEDRQSPVYYEATLNVSQAEQK